MQAAGKAAGDRRPAAYLQKMDRTALESEF